MVGWAEEVGGKVVGVVDAEELWSEESLGWFTSDFSVEAVSVVGAVLDSALVTVSVHHSVASLHLIASTDLVLRFHVSGGQIADCVSEVVVRVVIAAFEVVEG